MLPSSKTLPEVSIVPRGGKGTVPIKATKHVSSDVRVLDTRPVVGRDSSRSGARFRVTDLVWLSLVSMEVV